MKPSRILVAIIGVLSFKAAAQSSLGNPNLSTCPKDFHSIEIHHDAKLCQIFDEGLPATLVYHIKMTPAQAETHFVQIDNLSKRSTVRGRTLLSDDEDSKRVIISPDGEGSQIDILVIKAK